MLLPFKTGNCKNQKETGIPESAKRLNEDMPGNTFGFYQNKGFTSCEIFLPEKTLLGKTYGLLF
jgi:hypothetical protein